MKINFAQLRCVAAENGHPFAPVLLTAVIQAYLGGLERVLQFLMLNVAGVWLFSMLFFVAEAGDFILGLVMFWLISVLCGAVFASLYLEYLYCSKQSSFLTTVTGLSRLFCPDKNADHRHAELVKTQAEIESAIRHE